MRIDVLHPLAPDEPLIVQPSFSQRRWRSRRARRPTSPSARPRRRRRTVRRPRSRVQSGARRAAGTPARPVPWRRDRTGEARAHVLERRRRSTSSSCRSPTPSAAALAEPVVAAEDVPPFANSAVDGYAVRGSDVAEVPRRARRRRRGRRRRARPTACWRPGEAIRIMTGAPMPAGADAVVMVEDTERLDGGHRVRIGAAVAAGTSIRGVGDDVRVRDRAVRRRHRRHAGRRRRARQRQRPPGARHPPRPGRRAVDRRRADQRRLAAAPRADPREQQDDAARRWSPTPAARRSISASSATTRPRSEVVLRDAADRYDAIVTSGGVSMGDYDVVKAVLSRIADMRWMQIAIKPAKPFAFGLLDAGDRRRPRVRPAGQPGQLAGQLRAVRPAGAAQDDGPAGDRPPAPAAPSPTTAFRRRPDGKTHYMRAMASFGDDGRYHVSPVSAPRAAISWRPPRWPTRWSIVPDGDGCRRRRRGRHDPPLVR